MNKGQGKKITNPQNFMYDGSTMKVVIFACLIIILAVVFTGSISYFITRNAVVDKLKSRDLVYIIESATAKIDGRIARARETSLLLARDSAVNAWVLSAEKDEQLGNYSKDKLTDMAQNYDYVNSFIVSAITGNYWAEEGKLLQNMSEQNEVDRWFYETLNSGNMVSLNIDYNIGRNNTYVFLNALMGDVKHPIGIAGVGLSLADIAREFTEYKFGENSALWLVDGKGKIHLADSVEENGKYLNDFMPAAVAEQIIADTNSEQTQPQILEYVNAAGETVDLAYKTTKSTDWKVVLQINRSESIAVLRTIKINTAIASLIAVLMITLVFYLVSRRIANPLKRALILTQKMEQQVKERTKELAESNEKIMDSIEYARMLQESILPASEELKDILGSYFVLWRPRDIVGGDFFWVRRLSQEKSLVALVDCTGHGVPGAFMTMAVNSALKHIVEQNYTEPAEILAELNLQVKQTLHRNRQESFSDDGLDIAICSIEGDSQLNFAGAKLSLYIRRGEEIHIVRGNHTSIGYKASPEDLTFTSHSWDIEAGDQFYLTTDGYLDQNGGEKDYSFGRKKFLTEILAQQEEISRQGEQFEAALENYMADEAQRDDITLLGFSIH
ncbi:MAG: protein serine/threonine phosphatase [Firmicutes bacterium]|nr:protein serine/threonine phosphatase [Bacillota bacterium]